ncbi:MAG: histidine kinase [Proteobacteria bacterium]|nr:histidine kinase [Pseudomonadota bacterium]
MNFVDLAAVTIHDVKNRLAVLANRAEDQGDSATMRGVLEAAATLSRLLALYKADSGGLLSDIEARTPADLLAELAAEFGKQSALHFAVELSAAPNLWFYDENLVKMVLQDALYNALRHARREIRLSAVADGEWLEFSVHDDGPGYPPNMLDQALAIQPISREGTGLGLHLAGRVAALHRNGGREGYVRLSNANGARFSLLLPK